ncbi:MAG: hypothetical protein K1W24_12075 [Lachnospiraceae bacterium]
MINLDRTTKKKFIKLCEDEIKYYNETIMPYFPSKDMPNPILYSKKMIRNKIRLMMETLPGEFSVNIYEFLRGDSLTPVMVSGITVEMVYKKYRSIFFSLHAIMCIFKHKWETDNIEYMLRTIGVGKYED